MRGDRQVPGFCHGRNFARFREAATPGYVEHDNARGSRFQVIAEAPAGRQRLGCRNRRRRDFGIALQARQAVHLDWVFMPEGLVWLERLGDLHRRQELPHGVKLHHDVDLIADSLADLFERLEGELQVRHRDILAARLFCGCIEGPDLHRGYAVREQRFRQLVGAVQEAVQVVVGGASGEAVVCGRLACILLDVFSAGAGVVGADLFAAEATEQLGDRLVRHLAEDIPKCDVKGRIPSDLCAGRPEAEIAHQFVRQEIDLQRVAADDAWRDVFVHIAFHRLRAEECLPEPGDAFVGVDEDPEEIAALGDAHGFEPGDLHNDFLLSDKARAQQGLDTLVEVLIHQARCCCGFSGSDCVGNRNVEFAHRLPLIVARATFPAYRPRLSGDAAEGADDQGEQRVAGGVGDGKMQGNVVLHHLSRIVTILEHRAGMGRDRPCLRIRPAQGCQGRGTGFYGSACIVDLLDIDLIRYHAVLDRERECVVIQLRYGRALAGAKLDKMERSQGSQGFTNHRARYLKFFRQGAFGREAITWFQISITNKPGDRRDRAVDIVAPDLTLRFKHVLHSSETCMIGLRASPRFDKQNLVLRPYMADAES
ncbi:protein of unknown function [Pseudorhizobium banfieldiae]|uniref:Uncharacterized protein n=1 Tax=Pseudorhizobium banfieldiae TaxID=1125847 RepID=L0NK19_9HYPH|nr:protein of unknown function [Pseudorhizobium banfieldiae]